MPRILCLVLVLLASGLVHAGRSEEDRDGDGILDKVDLCPDDPEDKDGFEDKDGCPDDDNDQDRIPDARDKCPNEPETYNGYQDEDGCPDKARVNVISCPDVIMDRIYFPSGSARIQPVSRPILDLVATTLNANPSIVSVTSIGQASDHEPDPRALSLARAKAVMAYLVKKGVAAKRLHAVGKGTEADAGAPVTTAGPAVHRVMHFDMLRSDR